MCAAPPADILESFPEFKDRVGPRACILNDLSPAAVHIAFNYNTPVDVDGLKREFEQIKAATKHEMSWLYGTEHYEPAVGPYDPANVDVASRLKNTAARGSMHSLLAGKERTWELLTKAEVERGGKRISSNLVITLRRRTSRRRPFCWAQRPSCDAFLTALWISSLLIPPLGRTSSIQIARSFGRAG